MTTAAETSPGGDRDLPDLPDVPDQPDRGTSAGAVPPAGDLRRRDRNDRPVLPESTRDDTDAGWGERRADNDAWLIDQRPPHWD